MQYELDNTPGFFLPLEQSSSSRDPRDPHFHTYDINLDRPLEGRSK